MNAVAKDAAPTEFRLDLGCGKNKREGFIGIDCLKFDGVDAVTDLRAAQWVFDRNFGPCVPLEDNAQNERWRIADNSITEVNASHFVEHLQNTPEHPERVRFVNELYRILAPGGKATIVTPHWASNRAYGDFTHRWPPVSEMWFYYLNREWRKANAPHNDSEWNPSGYNCDFDATWGYTLNPAVLTKNPEYQQYAINNYKEICMDTVATLIKKAPPPAAS